MMWTEPDNGCLALVKGEEVAAGHNTLPKAESTTETVLVVEVATERCGLVRIEYRLQINKRGKARYRYWHAVRADRVESKTPERL